MEARDVGVEGGYLANWENGEEEERRYRDEGQNLVRSVVGFGLWCVSLSKSWMANKGDIRGCTDSMY